MKMKSKLLLSIFLGMVVLLFSSCTPSTVDTGMAVIPEEEIKPIIEEETVSESPQTEEEIPLMTIDELYQFIDSNPEILVVDVRSETNYQEAHIKGAISVPQTVISAGEWKPPDGKSLVLYWSWTNEAQSVRAAQELIEQGFSDIKVLLGGYDAWVGAGYPLETNNEKGSS